jgi:hypothetical protein
MVRRAQRSDNSGERWHRLPQFCIGNLGTETSSEESLSDTRWELLVELPPRNDRAGGWHGSAED